MLSFWFNSLSWRGFEMVNLVKIHNQRMHRVLAKRKKYFTATCVVGCFFFGLTSAVANENDAVSSLRRADGSVIDYYLEVASDNLSSDTLLVSFQGSDCNSVKHNNLIRELSHAAWPAADLLLIEKPGITSDLPRDTNAERPDCPAYYLENDRPEQRVQDANTVVSDMVSDGSYKNVIALGGSEGAVVAALYAAEYDTADAVIMINGGGRWFIDDVNHNIKLTEPESAVASAIEGFNGFAEHILSSNERLDIDVSNHGYAWWRSMLSIDQESVLSRVEIPALIVQGGSDESVSPEAVAELVENLHDLGKFNIELMAYPEMDHGLSDQDGRPMTQDVAESIRGWLINTSDRWRD